MVIAMRTRHERVLLEMKAAPAKGRYEQLVPKVGSSSLTMTVMSIIRFISMIVPAVTPGSSISMAKG
jgi:hypothetical protein